MHSYTHGIHITGMPYADLHAQWSVLETATLSPQATQVLSQLLDAEKKSPPVTDSVTLAASSPSNAPQSSPISAKHVNDSGKFPLSILLGWTSYDDPPKAPITTRILGTALRPVFGKNLCLVTDDYLKTNRTFTYLGVSNEVAKLAETPGSVNIQGWRINWKKATKAPWSPWVPGKIFQTPSPAPESKTDKKKRGRKRERSISSGNLVSNSHSRHRDSKNKPKKQALRRTRRSRSKSRSRRPRQSRSAVRNHPPHTGMIPPNLDHTLQTGQPPAPPRDGRCTTPTLWNSTSSTCATTCTDLATSSGSTKRRAVGTAMAMVNKTPSQRDTPWHQRYR